MTQEADTNITKPAKAAPSLDNMQAELATAQGELASNTSAISIAASTNDIQGMIKAARGVDAAEKTIARLEAAIKRASFGLRDAERDAAKAEIMAEGCMYPAESIKKYVDLSITGYTVIFSEDGTTAEVQVKVKGSPTSSGVKKVKSGETIGRGRKQFRYNGGVWDSRELLQNFGDALPAPDLLFQVPGMPVVKSAEHNITTLGEWALFRVEKDNFRAAGMEFSPGFDAPVTKLAEAIGAERVVD